MTAPSPASVRALLRRGHSLRQIARRTGTRHSRLARICDEADISPEAAGLVRTIDLERELGLAPNSLRLRSARTGTIETRRYGRYTCVTRAEAQRIRDTALPTRREYPGWLSTAEAARVTGLTTGALSSRVRRGMPGLRWATVAAAGTHRPGYVFHPGDVRRLAAELGRRGRLRVAAGLTRAELMRLLGVSKACVALWHRSATPPPHGLDPRGHRRYDPVRLRAWLAARPSPRRAEYLAALDAHLAPQETP